MADAEHDLRQFDVPGDVETIAIVANERGAQRAIGTHAVRLLGFPYSVSPTFLRNSQNQTPAPYKRFYPGAQGYRGKRGKESQEIRGELGAGSESSRQFSSSSRTQTQVLTERIIAS